MRGYRRTITLAVMALFPSLAEGKIKEVRRKNIRLPRHVGTIAMFVVTIAATANAQSISKSFEFGPGLQYGRSVVRAYPVAARLEVSAVIKFQRLGPSGSADDVPIDIELREPDTSAGVEGPIVETIHASASRTEKTVTIGGLPSNRGCPLPWRVRVKFAGTGDSPQVVFGSARIAFDARERSINAQIPGFISKNGSAKINIGGPEGIEQGQLTITANWNHMIGPVPGPNPIKMRVVLGYEVGTNQTFLAAVEAYSSNESNRSPQFRMTHNLSERKVAQFKLYFTNLEKDHDAFIQPPTVKFAPICP